MFRRKRRKQRVVWLTPTGTVLAPGEAAPGDAFDQLGGIIIDSTAVTVGGGSNPTIEIPLVVDNSTNEQFAGAPLSVLQQGGLNQSIQWGYRLKRIVGSIHLAVSSQDSSVQDNPFSGVMLTAGIIVRRVDATGVSVVPGNETSPQLLGQWTDPWIWRRTWVLTLDPSNLKDVNQGIVNRLGHFAFNVFPYTTSHYGDVRSGPHVDTKIARRIGAEERLFLDIAVCGLPLNQAPGVSQPVNVSGVIDLRVLASTFANNGNRRNASR